MFYGHWYRKIIPCMGLLAALFARGQPIKTMPYYAYNVNEGLLQSHVTSITQDGMGFIWVSTGSGIQRFDGNRFYPPPLSKEDSAVPKDKYARLFALKNGDLWIFHETGITSYEVNRNRFTRILNYSDPSRYYYMMPIEETEEGIWCFVPKKGIYLIRNQPAYFADSLLLNDRFPSSRVPAAGKHSIILSSTTELLVSDTRNRNIYFFHPSIEQGAFHAWEYYSGDSILLATDRGIEWMNTVSGKTRMVCSYPSEKRSPPALFTIILKKINDHRVVLAINNQLYELDPVSRTINYKLINLQKRPFVEIGYINFMMLDRYQNLWLLTQNRGIRKIHLHYPEFRYYGTEDKKKNFIKCLAVDKPLNRVLAGTFEQGLLVFDTLQHLLREFRLFPGAPSPCTISNMIKVDSVNYLLFLMGNSGTDWNIFLLDARHLSVKRMIIDAGSAPPLQPLDYYLTPLKINDSLYYLQNSYAVYTMLRKGSNRIEMRYFIRDLPSPTISSYLDDENRLWLGSSGYYFLKASPEQPLKEFRLPSRVLCSCFLKDSRGNMWMGTEQGLYLLDSRGEIKKVLGPNEGLINDNIYAIKEDRDGQIWFSHNQGLSSLDSVGRIKHYTRNDGLQENEFNTGAACITGDGELFFGGVNGISSFKPTRVILPDENVQLLVQSIRVRNEEWKAEVAAWKVQKLVLPYYKNSLSLEFTGMGRKNPDQYIYQHRLKGIDETWINDGNRGLATYVLSPGKYFLEMKVGEGNSNSNAAIKTIEIIIQPPFWKATWFISALVASFVISTVATTLLVARNKLKKRVTDLEQKRQLDKERLRISREMHDDIGAGLTQITLMSEAAKSDPENRGKIDQIAEASRMLVGNMNEIIWSMHPENNTLDLLLAYMREQLYKLLEYSPLRFRIDFPEVKNPVILSSAQRRNILLIIKEIVHNSIKHSHATFLSINGILEKDKIVFVIKDDGVGFDVLKTGSGNGMTNIRKRMEEIKGSTDVQSQPGMGTIIYCRIPLVLS